MFAGEDVVVVTLTSCPKSLEYMTSFCNMALLHCRLNFSRKNELQMNDRSHGVEIIYSPYNDYHYVINMLTLLFVLYNLLVCFVLYVFIASCELIY